MPMKSMRLGLAPGVARFLAWGILFAGGGRAFSANETWTNQVRGVWSAGASGAENVTNFTRSLSGTNHPLPSAAMTNQPTGTIADVRHVVIFIQENRSFDHYFGSLHGAHGFSDRAALTFQNGANVFEQPGGAVYELPFHSSLQCISDLAHDWDT